MTKKEYQKFLDDESQKLLSEYIHSNNTFDKFINADEVSPTEMMLNQSIFANEYNVDFSEVSLEFVFQKIDTNNRIGLYRLSCKKNYTLAEKIALQEIFKNQLIESWAQLNDIIEDAQLIPKKDRDLYKHAHKEYIKLIKNQGKMLSFVPQNKHNNDSTPTESNIN